MYRVLRPENFPKIERPCPECNRPTVSTGQLFFNDEEPPGSPHAWFIVFECPLDDLVPAWTPELAPLIRKHTAAVDPDALPILGE